MSQNFNTLFVYTAECIVGSNGWQEILTEQQMHLCLREKLRWVLQIILVLRVQRLNRIVNNKIFRRLHCTVFCFCNHEKIREWTESRLKTDFQVSISSSIQKWFLKNSGENFNLEKEFYHEYVNDGDKCSVIFFS